MEEIEDGLLETNITQENNLTLGSRAFGVYGSHWIVSGSVYAPILGDIFNFIKMMNAVQQAAPLNRQRIVISTEIPYKQPKILEDGFIDFGKPSNDASKQCFYVILRNFELVGLCYDPIMETVCDISPEYN